MKYQHNSYKLPMFIVAFENMRGSAKQIKFFNPDKAFNFYKKLKSSPSIKKVIRYKMLITPAEKKAMLAIIKNRKG